MMVFTDGTADEQYYSWQAFRVRPLRRTPPDRKDGGRSRKNGLENYKPLALFLRSVVILEITKLFGDVPYSEAIQATSGVDKPAYDLQQNIYAQVLSDLEEANATLDVDAAGITGDVIYDGNLLKWKQLINSYTLRVLMSLSLKQGNATLNVKNRFKAIVDDPTGHPIFEIQ
jgi:hypothetical protein